MGRKMCCVQVIGLKVDLLPTIYVLGALGCVDVDHAPRMPGVLVSGLVIDPDLVRRQEGLNKKLFEINSLIEILGLNQETIPPGVQEETEPLQALLDQIETLAPKVQKLVTYRDKLRAEQELLPRFLVTVRKLMPLFPETAHDPAAVSFGLLIDRNHAEVLEILAGHVAEVTSGEAQIASGEVDAATCAMLIAAPGSYAEAIAAVLDEHDVTRLRLPPEFDSRSSENAIASLNERIQVIPAEYDALERELHDLGEAWAARLHAGRLALRNELEIYKVFPLLGQTQTTFVLVGWVPEDEVSRIKTALEQQVGDRLAMTLLPMTEELKKKAPVVLENPRVARPFESLVNLFGTPRYEGLDPTVLMAIFMPVFFGMMLGDIGYGILLLGLAWGLRRRLGPGTARDVVTILGIGSVWAIVFGVLYGELFGTLGEAVGLHPVLFDRADSAHLLDLLGLTIAIGAAHLTLGLLLGIWEGIRERNRHDLLERGGRLLGLMALFLIVGVLVDLLPSGFMTPAIAILIIGTALLAASLGKIGLLVAPIEMIGLVGNVLSYLRIAAIGLSSVYLALVAGEMVGVVGSVVVGVLIAVLLHALNLVLGAFSPTIQSLRLHYVEFFRNFYAGGGRLYEPFQLRVQRQDLSEGEPPWMRDWQRLEQDWL